MTKVKFSEGSFDGCTVEIDHLPADLETGATVSMPKNDVDSFRGWVYENYTVTGRVGDIYTARLLKLELAPVNDGE
jgi:hypothetical protein